MLKNFISSIIPNKDHEQPFYFERKNICVHCGVEGQLVFIDRFGRETKTDVHAFDHIKCKNCGEVYSIIWNREDTSEKMYPSAIDRSIKTDFVNIVKNEVETFLGYEKEKKI